VNAKQKTDQAAKSIEDLGYAVIKDVFSDNLTSEFLNKLEDIPKKRIGYGGVNICHTKFLHTSESFMNILSKDEIFMLSQRICGDRCRLDHAFYHDCKKNEGLKKGESLINKNIGAGIHGGVNCCWGMNFYRSGYPININFPRTNRLNFHITLTDTGPFRGGPQLIPSTHIGDYNYPMCGGDNVKVKANGEADVDFNKMIIPQSRKGDVIVFLDSLLHGTSFHRFERRNLYLMVTSAFTSMYPYSMLNKEIAHLAKNERQKQMLAEPCAVPQDSLKRTLESIK